MLSLDIYSELSLTSNSYSRHTENVRGKSHMTMYGLIELISHIDQSRGIMAQDTLVAAKTSKFRTTIVNRIIQQ